MTRLRGLLPLLAALAIGIVCDFAAFLAMGFGHGTYIPMAIFFGPMLLLPGALKDSHFLVAQFISFPLLYVAYCQMLRMIKHQQLGLTIILLLHYASAVAFIYRRETELTYMRRVWHWDPKVLTACAFLFVVANLSLFALIRFTPSADPKTCHPERA
jgi:hypothetical protein